MNIDYESINAGTIESVCDHFSRWPKNMCRNCQNRFPRKENQFYWINILFSSIISVTKLIKEDNMAIKYFLN